MRAHAWRCAGPRCSASASSPVAACHKPMRSAGVGTGTRQTGRASPSRSKLPSGPAATSTGPFQPGMSFSRRRSPGASSAQITGIAAASHSHGPRPSGGSPSRKSARAPRCRQISAATAFASRGWPLRTTIPDAARRDSARARLAAASRRLGGNGGGSGMPTRSPGHERTGGSASARTIGCGTISERSGMERVSFSA